MCSNNAYYVNHVVIPRLTEGSPLIFDLDALIKYDLVVFHVPPILFIYVPSLYMWIASLNLALMNLKHPPIHHLSDGNLPPFRGSTNVY